MSGMKKLRMGGQYADPVHPKPRKPAVAPARHDPSKSQPYTYEIKLKSPGADAPAVHVTASSGSGQAASSGAERGVVRDGMGRPVRDSSGKKVRSKLKMAGRA